VNNCATSEVIKNYIENQENQDEKEALEQVKISESEQFLYTQSIGMNISSCLQKGKQPRF
jgi:hypothetical protein